MLTSALTSVTRIIQNLAIAAGAVVKKDGKNHTLQVSGEQ
jgi:hypothetical protein